MRASRGFNARRLRQIRDFAVSHRADGSAVLYLRAARAEDPAAQAALEQTGRRAFDSLTIELSREDIEKLDRILGLSRLSRELVRGVAQGLGSGVVAALTKSDASTHQDFSGGKAAWLAARGDQ